MTDNKFLPKLSQNLLEILDDDNEYYDITIEVGNDPYVKIFRAHMIILNYRSSFLRRILSTNKRKNGETLVHIKLPDIFPEIFQIILRYIYGGIISLEEYDASDIIKVLMVARKLSLQELIPHLQSFLIQNKSTWMEQNFNLVYQTSFENDSFLELQKFCTELISKEPEKIFKSPDFTSISEKFLISLIQNDNLQMSGVQVWEYVLKWGFAKNPELFSDNLTSFSKDDFNALKNTLQQCIPFVKFRNLTSREFSDKVFPYKKIFPKELYKDLLKYFLDYDSKPASEPEINSRVSASSKTLHRSSPGNQFQFTNNMATSEKRFAALMNMRNGTSSTIFGRRLGRTRSGSTLLSPLGGVVSSHQMHENVMQKQVLPLERSENRWVLLGSVQHCEVNALLNELTLEKFDSISDQIIDYANRSRDGHSLREVTRLIFEKSCHSCDECAIYAQLCRKLMEGIDPEIIDENVKNTEGRFVQGGTLFRKYLLNRCQEEFEKGWKVNIPLPSNEKGEPDMMSDEYYAAAKVKRQGLGLICFIGELFKLNMLTERIMHECIKKLLIFQGSPEEEEMESLCKLLTTVGEHLDHCVKTNQEHKVNQLDDARAKQLMDSYFSRLTEISKLPNLSIRIEFMIMDVIDLRSNFWEPRFMLQR